MKEYPEGFFKVVTRDGQKSWGHWCPRCKHLTLAVNTAVATNTSGTYGIVAQKELRFGTIFKVWCCGRVRELKFSWWRALTLPTHRMPQPALGQRRVAEVF